MPKYKELSILSVIKTYISLFLPKIIHFPKFWTKTGYWFCKYWWLLDHLNNLKKKITLWFSLIISSNHHYMICYQTTYSDFVINHLIEFDSYRPRLLPSHLRFMAIACAFLLCSRKNLFYDSFPPFSSFYSFRHPMLQQNNILRFSFCL